MINNRMISSPRLIHFPSRKLTSYVDNDLRKTVYLNKKIMNQTQDFSKILKCENQDGIEISPYDYFSNLFIENLLLNQLEISSILAIEEEEYLDSAIEKLTKVKLLTSTVKNKKGEIVGTLNLVNFFFIFSNNNNNN